MTNQEKIEIEEMDIQNIRIKLTERDCPRCDAVLIHNNNEQCFECLNCGYIDCGENKN
jgi:ribosomal protein S27AE